MRTLVLLLLVAGLVPLAMPTADAYACYLSEDDLDGWAECEANRAEQCIQNTLEKRPWCPA